MKILIIGHARHGKDTVAEFLRDDFGFTFKSSSEAAAEIFLYDQLKDKYGYESFTECYEDRMNHRQEWYEAIVEFTKEDRTALATEIMKSNDIYVGMRDDEEIQACVANGVFDLILGVYCPWAPEEDKTSFNIDLWKESDLVIPNAGTLEDLRRKVKTVANHLWMGLDNPLRIEHLNK